MSVIFEFVNYVSIFFSFTDSESEEELPEPTINPVKPKATTASNPTTSKQVKIVEPKKDEDSSDDEDEDDTSAEDEESSEDQVDVQLLVSYQLVTSS